MLEKALELLKIFEDNGYEAYIVGGFVRDYIMQRVSNDIDICTNATPMEVKKIFSDVELPFEGYGSVHLNYKKVNFEITTYRMDLEYKNKRNPSKIMYTDKLIIDLKRRDFTMNTLCIDKDGKVIDLLNSTSDIQNKVIKTVGNANKRLSEDSLRILRAIRFGTELNFKLDDELKDAIINNKHLLRDLSFFRKKQELNKIFSSKNALYGIKLLKELDLGDYLEIKINDNIVKTSDLIGMWVQVNPSSNYQFTSNEKKYMSSILRVINNGYIDDLELYYEGNYVCFIAAQILNLNEVNMYDRYDLLPIKRQSDINFKPTDIVDKLKDKANIKLIMKDIEKKIILGKLPNCFDNINKYVIDTYSNLMI